jgi:hypothetical protein
MNNYYRRLLKIVLPLVLLTSCATNPDYVDPSKVIGFSPIENSNQTSAFRNLGTQKLDLLIGPNLKALVASDSRYRASYGQSPIVAIMQNRDTRQLGSDILDPNDYVERLTITLKRNFNVEGVIDSLREIKPGTNRPVVLVDLHVRAFAPEVHGCGLFNPIRYIATSSIYLIDAIESPKAVAFVEGQSSKTTGCKPTADEAFSTFFDTRNQSLSLLGERISNALGVQ